MKKKLGGFAAIFGAAAAAFLATRGHSTPPKPPPPPVVVQTTTLIVHLCEGPCSADHKVRGATLQLGDQRIDTDGAGNAEFPALALGHDYEVCAEPAGFTRGCATASLTRSNQELDLALERNIPAPLQVRVDGRFWVTDAGTFRPLLQSDLSALVRDVGSRDAFLDETRALGFNGVRVFAGDLGWAGQTPAIARAALPGFLEAATARGLYVYVSALQGGGYDIEAHLRDVAATVATRANAILEVANEIGHPTQSDLGKDPSRLLGVARRVIPAGVLWTLGAPVDTDEPTPEGRYPTDGGLFNDAHLDRQRDLYNQVRRLREIAAVSDSTRKPAMSGEPIGIAEGPMTKQRFWGDDALRFSFAYGVLCRGFELGCVWHSEDGLNARPLGPNTRAAAEAFIAGWHAIPTDERLTFVNAGWAGSPVAGADFDHGIVRAYSFVAGGRGWTVLVGVRGDPAVRWGGGWHPVSTRELPGLQIVEIAR